jgi:hypothetical protein
MSYPYEHDWSHNMHDGAIVRTSPGAPDKVMDIGRVIESGGNWLPSRVAWLTRRRNCELVHSHATPDELLLLTHPAAQIVVAQLDRERNPGTAYLWTVAIAAEVWLDKLTDGADLGADDLNRYVEIAYPDVLDGFNAMTKEKRLIVKAQFEKVERQRMQEDYQACLKRMRAGSSHVL